MDSNQLSEILKNGENSRVQFKERLDNQDSIAAELIAFSNSKGGLLIFGVNDKTGEAIGLNYIQIQDYGNKIGTIANELIKPQVFITTEVVDICGKSLLVVDVAEGIAKPYKDRNGTIWIKQGADKRRLTDNNEQIRLFQQSGLIYIDEMKVPYTGIEDIDTEKVKKYLVAVSDEDEPITPTLLKNINVTKEDQLTLGGLLFFGKKAGQSFNSTGLLEISPVVLEELLQNALTHRDYSKNAPIRICIFDNRVEIISPGKLPNSLTVENIKRGNAVVRNNLIVSYSTKLMRYRGFGSGIVRALKEQPDISFINDVDGEQFTVIIPRKQQ